MRLAAAVLFIAAPGFAAVARSAGGEASPVAVPAGAPRALPPGPTSLPPLLIGELAEPHNPVRAALERHAGVLEGLGAGRGLAPEEAADYLAPLTAPRAHPTDRLAAGVLSRAAVSREDREALLERHPVLAAGAVAGLDGLVKPASAYRGSLLDADSPLLQLAESRRADPAVSALFDGGRGIEDMALEGLSQDGGRLYLGGRRLKPLSRDSPRYAHPRLAGVELVLQREESDFAFANAARDAGALAEAGAGPRVLAQGALLDAAGRRGRLAAVSLIEAVEGPTLWDVIAGARLKRDEHEAVQELLDRLSDAGLEPEVMEKANILVGRTAADPRLRAFLVEPGGFRSHGDLSPESLRRKLLARDLFDRMDIIHGGDNAMADPVYKPLEDILREGLFWGTKDPFWRSWGRAIAGVFRRGPKP